MPTEQPVGPPLRTVVWFTNRLWALGYLCCTPLVWLLLVLAPWQGWSIWVGGPLILACSLPAYLAAVKTAETQGLDPRGSWGWRAMWFMYAGGGAPSALRVLGP